MVSSYSCGKSSVNVAEDPEFAEPYSSSFVNERNFLCHPKYNDKQEHFQDDVLSRDGNICRDMIFVDGNDRDLETCKYEDTLVERVWWSCKPPKIPKLTRVVPARRIQVMVERLSPTVPGLPILKKPSSREVTKNGNRRHKIKSDINYVAVNDFDVEKQTSCQVQTLTITPECARRLDDLL